MKNNATLPSENSGIQPPVFKIGLIIAIIFQCSVLVVEYLGSVWPIWTGTPIILKTQPIDPRSLFRGNFVRLNYQINRIEVPVASDFKLGSIVYVSLKEHQGYWSSSKVASIKPQSGLFIRGRVRRYFDQHLSIEYGIEAPFMPKAKALSTEETLSDGAFIRVFIAGSGKARPDAFVCQSVDCMAL